MVGYGGLPEATASGSSANRQRVMVGLIAASFLLVVVAMAGGSAPTNAPISLADKLSAIQTLAEAPKGAPATPAAVEATKEAALAKEVSPAKAEEAPATKPAEAPKAEAPKADPVATAASSAPAAPKAAEPAAATPKAEASEAADAPKAVEAPKTAVAVPKAEDKKPAVAEVKQAAAHASPVIAKQAAIKNLLASRAISGSKLADTNSTATVDAAAEPAAEPAAKGEKKEGAAGAEGAAAGGDQFNSPMGNLNPTGIMSVFFNEKVGFLLLSLLRQSIDFDPDPPLLA